MTLRKSDNYSKSFWTNFGQGMKKARFNGLFKVVLIHPEGIEPPSQEPESYVISITLRVEMKNLHKASFYWNYNSMSPKRSAIENPD